MYEPRILTWKQAAAIRHQYRKTGDTLVMTNGVFDVLHRGHAEYLAKASAFGNHLWVAVNSDESVRRLKGDKRPLVSLSDRAYLLNAFRFVHSIVPFDQDTPRELYALLLPDVLVKGADYTVDQIAGAKEVIANGGRVERVDLVPEKSTTGLIERIIERYGKGA